MEKCLWTIFCCGMIASAVIAAPVTTSTEALENVTTNTRPAKLEDEYEETPSSTSRNIWTPRSLRVSGNVLESMKLSCPLRKMCRSAKKRFGDTPLAEELCAIERSEVQWFRKSGEGMEKLTAVAVSERVRSKGKRLTFRKLLDSDSGKYACTGADNTSIVAVINLSVKQANRELHFTKHPQQASLLQRSHSLTLHCNAGGYPTPIVFWLKSFTRVKATGRVHAKGGTLQISNARTGDTAVYRCVADNGVHRHIVSESKVFVH